MNAIEKLDSNYLKTLEKNKKLSSTAVKIQGEKVTNLEENMKKLQSLDDRK